MKIPKLINSLDQPAQMIRLERWKDFQEITYPLSAREISEMTEIPAPTIRNYTAGREIPRYFFGLISKTKVRHFIQNKIITRANSKGVYSPKSLLSIVIKRLKKDVKAEDAEKASKAKEMLKKLGVR